MSTDCYVQLRISQRQAVNLGLLWQQTGTPPQEHLYAAVMEYAERIGHKVQTLGLPCAQVVALDVEKMSSDECQDYDEARGYMLVVLNHWSISLIRQVARKYSVDCDKVIYVAINRKIEAALASLNTTP